MLIDAFLPSDQATITVSVTGASQTVAIPAPGAFLEVNNSGSVIVFMELGAANQVAAVATGYPILPGQCKVVRRDIGEDGTTDTHIALIGQAAGPTAVFVTAGNGT